MTVAGWYPGSNAAQLHFQTTMKLTKLELNSGLLDEKSEPINTIRAVAIFITKAYHPSAWIIVHSHPERSI